MIDRRRMLIAFASQWALLATAPCLAGPGTTSYPLRQTRGGRLLLPIRVNGTEVEALLDSGAEASLLDRAFAASIGLVEGEAVTARGSGAGTVEATLVSGVTLEAVGLRLADQTLAVLDLSDVGTRLLGHPLPAVLGREVFDAARLAIDIEDLTIAAVSREIEPPGTRLALTTEHGIETMPVRVEGGQPVQAAFDLGNGSNVLLGADYVQRAGLLENGRPVELERGGGIGGEVERRVIVIDSLEVAGRKFRNVRATIEDSETANDVNVGVAILRHFLITTDFAADVVWLAPRE